MKNTLIRFWDVGSKSAGVWLIVLLALAPIIIPQFTRSELPVVPIVLHKERREILPIEFKNGLGEPNTLADFKGRIVLLNVWATWCGPCKQEMPSLSRLAAQFPDNELAIIPLSVDVSGLSRVEYFYKSLGVSLPIYVDTSMDAMHELGVFAIPTTLLIDREGKEMGRLVGPTKWDHPDIVDQLVSATGLR